MTRRAQWVVAAAAVLAALVFFLVRARYYAAWMDDDAFISFRYARNLVRGAGLVYNVGERVEGYSNFLWTILLAGAHALGVPLPETARVLGLTFAVATGFLLLVSLLCLYALPHIMERILLVGAGFALVLIGSSRPTLAKPQLKKYAAYLAISIGTYYLLFQNQPWEFLFGWLPGGLKQVAIPVAVCSIIMAFDGWLLLPGSSMRRLYLLITLPTQILLSFGLFGAIDDFFGWLARMLHYTGEFTASSKAWQLVWMLNYYLPIYWWSHGSHA